MLAWRSCSDSLALHFQCHVNGSLQVAHNFEVICAKTAHQIGEFAVTGIPEGSGPSGGPGRERENKHQEVCRVLCRIIIPSQTI